MAEAKPSRMTRAEFIETFGRVFEHSAWVAERTWEMGQDALWDTADGLHRAMAAAVDLASDDDKLALLCAHPDLAGRLALAGDLTRESAREQSSAGLDQCTPEELERSFPGLVAAGRMKFVPYTRTISSRQLIERIANRLREGTLRVKL